MNRFATKAWVFLLSTTLFAFGCTAEPENAADMVLKNGKIVTAASIASREHLQIVPIFIACQIIK